MFDHIFETVDFLSWGSLLVDFCSTWGVDFVECADPDTFLASINWDALKSARPSDGIFELRA